MSCRARAREVGVATFSTPNDMSRRARAREGNDILPTLAERMTYRLRNFPQTANHPNTGAVE